MRIWHVAAWVLILATPATRAQTCTLSESVKPGDCFRYGIDMKLSGEMRFRKDDKTVPVKLSASASQTLDERALAVKGALIEKSARVYGKATATIQAGSDKSTRGLRDSRRLIVAQRHKDQPLAYCPKGALYRGELDLVSDHFDTLTIAGILPGKVVKVGETWKLPSPVVQALANLHGVTEQKVEAKLEKVTGDTAVVGVRGPVSGVDNGAMVKMQIESTATFDLKGRRLTKLVWKQKETRDQGPVSPASVVELNVTLTRQSIKQPTTLSDVALVSVPEGFKPPASLTSVEYRDSKGRFSLLHARDWQLVAETGDHTVFRLLDKGDFVAQVTLTPWAAAKKGEHQKPEDFEKAMHATSGWEPEQKLQAGKVPATDGKYIYRLSEVGKLDDVQVMQNFYLIAVSTGEQVVMAFTLSPKQADKLGARDLALAGSLEVPAPKVKK